MKQLCLVLACSVLISSCLTTSQNPEPFVSKTAIGSPYTNDLGDIVYDPAFDSDDFTLCDSTSTMQGRSRLRYPGGIKALEELCKSKFEDNPDFNAFTGYIMIRFMINCEHKTGRFRAESLALDFSPQDCPTALKDQLLEISKNLSGWEKSSREKPTAEYSKYINFKIDNGRIEHVLM